MTGLAERFPGDTDLLEATMQVDHAATQQARHAQSLKVLCGEWPGQQWQKPLALVDVVRAASGRIVAYRRVTVTGEPDLGVHASVVEPLIHLVAELLANATEYSPPRTSVLVTVRAVQRGAVIEVDDGGLGLDEYRLGHAREIVSGRRLLGVGEVGEIPQTGFAVVGRFADRHGFQVDLGPSPYGGVRAVVLIPLELLETLEPAGSRSAQPPAAAPPAHPTPAPAAEPPAPRERPGAPPAPAFPSAAPGAGRAPAPPVRRPREPRPPPRAPPRRPATGWTPSSPAAVASRTRRPPGPPTPTRTIPPIPPKDSPDHDLRGEPRAAGLDDRRRRDGAGRAPGHRLQR
ncbi:ATP-binding protein [Streptomyces sp. FR-008]|uniref:ATP-binding protein n=1 Tax=Streptomyces sp. FR-008 TaxID=206662 RepID=UPI0026920403